MTEKEQYEFQTAVYSMFGSVKQKDRRRGEWVMSRDVIQKCREAGTSKKPAPENVVLTVFGRPVNVVDGENILRFDVPAEVA